jgi:hypothetical protein
MRRLSVATCVLLFTLTGYAAAQDHHWPPTDPDPYFKKRDAEKEAQQEPKWPPARKYPQDDSD